MKMERRTQERYRANREQDLTAASYHPLAFLPLSPIPVHYLADRLAGLAPGNVSQALMCIKHLDPFSNVES